MRAMESLLFWPVAALVTVTIAALLFRHALVRAFRRWTGHRHETKLILQAIRVPSMSWCVVLGLFVALQIAELPPRLAAQIQVVLESAIILSVTITVASVLGSLVAAASERHALAVGVTGLFRTSVRLVVLVVGAVVMLGSLGIAITPILTALGVGGIAVALALQDTLSNLFAGIHLLADRPIRVGDYVRLSAHDVEGHVLDVGWRSTRIRMPQNSVVIVPNTLVAESVITNFDLDSTRIGVTIRVGVGYDADPDHVERVLVEEATAPVGQVPRLLGDPPCQAHSFVDQFIVQHELRKRISNACAPRASPCRRRQRCAPILSSAGTPRRRAGARWPREPAARRARSLVRGPSPTRERSAGSPATRRRNRPERFPSR